MGYLTGNDAGGATLCRQIVIPDDFYARIALSGALLELTHAFNWEQYGTLTPEEQAQLFVTAFDTLGECGAMVDFPLSGLLDNFNRADESAATGWTAHYYNLRVEAGLAKTSSYADAAAFWGAGDYGPDCEVYATLAIRPGFTCSLGVLARIAPLTLGTSDGYIARASYNPAGSHLVLGRITNEAVTNLVTPVSHAIYSGDKIGLRCVGDDQELWFDDGAGWELIATAHDTTYNRVGRLGVVIESEYVGVDNFGGGGL